jgi:hypothetical protein
MDDDNFTERYNEGCKKLGLIEDKDAAGFFEISVHNARRWREGKVVPPVRQMVLRFIEEQVKKRGL